MQTSLLSPAQDAAVNSDSSNILVTASAGSGKTSVLVERIARLMINDGVDPAGIVAITFTVKAAEEISSRLTRGFFAQPVKLSAANLSHVGTLHSFLLKLIQQHAATLGYPPRLAVLDEEQSDDLLMRCAEDLNCPTSLKKLRGLIGASNIPPREWLVLKRFNLQMRSNGVISYDMILSEGLKLIQQIDLPYTHLFVDEIQDAAPLDAQIYEALPITNKFLVGDPDQAIFGFRGGCVGYILSLAKAHDLAAHEWFGEVIRIEENYRSDRAICAAAQRLIEHNVNRVEKTLRPVSEYPGEVRVKCYPTAAAEKFGHIDSLLNRPSFISLNSVAVLLRTNKLVDEWRETLIGAGIPVASRQHTERPADWPWVKAAIAVLNDPTNDWLCYSLIRQKDGEETANRIKLEASAHNRSINAQTFHLPLDLVPAAYKPILARLGASGQSLSLVKHALEHLTPEATGAELMAALAEGEYHEEQIGAGVWVGTIHSAKGKEFDSVFVPCFEQEIIPGNKTGPELEEERRVSYVAFTRARHRLFISHCESRKPAYGGWRPVPATPSQFLFEAGLFK